MLAANANRNVFRIATFHHGSEFERIIVALGSQATFIERIPVTDNRHMRKWVQQLDKYIDAVVPPEYMSLAGVSDDDGDFVTSARAAAAQVRDESMRSAQKREEEALDRFAGNRRDPSGQPAYDDEKRATSRFSRMERPEGAPQTRASATYEQPPQPQRPYQTYSAEPADGYTRPNRPGTYRSTLDYDTPGTAYGSARQQYDSYTGERQYSSGGAPQYSSNAGAQPYAPNGPQRPYGADAGAQQYAPAGAQQGYASADTSRQYSTQNAPQREAAAQPVFDSTEYMRRPRKPVPRETESVISSLDLHGVLLNAVLVDGSFLRYALERQAFFFFFYMHWVRRGMLVYVSDASVNQATMNELQFARINPDALRTRDKASRDSRASRIKTADIVFDNCEGFIEDTADMDLSNKLLVCDSIRPEQFSILNSRHLSRIAVLTPDVDERFVTMAELEAMIALYMRREPREVNTSDWVRLMGNFKLKQEIFRLD